MRMLLMLVVKGAGPNHRAVFHAFAEGLARMLRPRRGEARVRPVGR